MLALKGTERSRIFSWSKGHIGQYGVTLTRNEKGYVITICGVASKQDWYIW